MNNPSMQNPSGGNGTTAGSQTGGTNGGDVKSSAESVARQARDQGQERIQSARQTTADSIEKLADGVREAASELERDSTVGNLSQYITQFADSMTGVASGLRERSGDDLVREISRLSRENPTLFVAGAVALGFGLTRFARASSTHTHRGLGSDIGSPQYGSTRAAGSTGYSTGATTGSGYAAGSTGTGYTTGSSTGSTSGYSADSSIGSSTGAGYGSTGSSGSGYGTGTGTTNSLGDSSTSSLGSSSTSGSSSSTTSRDTGNSLGASSATGTGASSSRTTGGSLGSRGSDSTRDDRGGIK